MRRGVLPLLVLLVFIAAVWVLDPVPRLNDSPPHEELSVERVEINPQGFAIRVRANGNAAIDIAQVMVDGAYWVFSQTPPGSLARLDSAWLTIDYPWVAGEAHHLRLITAIGSTFDHTIEVALQSPRASPSVLLNYALLGLVVGLLPVTLGMLFFPALRALGDGALEFILALTVGLLGYLFVDMTLEGLNLAQRASAAFGGPILVVVALVLTTLALTAIAQRPRAGRGARQVAGLIAGGIGLHNFGEGLAIGAAFAVGELALGSFLIVGFTLHNTTEGVGIVAPLARERAPLGFLAGLALLAGVPTVPGIWVGALVFSPHYAALFFAIGAGAVLRVMLEIDAHVNRGMRADGRASRFSARSVAGYCSGALIMYASALLIGV